jgi:glycosyltransferase involved in cell wall biosynthesis
MKIFLVSMQYAGNITGGEGVHVTELSRELVRKGHSVTVLTSGRSGQEACEDVVLEDLNADKQTKSQIRVPVRRFFALDPAEFAADAAGFESDLIAGRDFILQVLGFLRAQDEQEGIIVHLHGHFMIPSLAWDIKKFTRFTVITSIHRAESIYEERGIMHTTNPRVLDYLEEREIQAINYSDAVVVRSTFVKEMVSEIYQDRIRNKHIRVIPSAISMSFFNTPHPNLNEVQELKKRHSIEGDLILNLSIIEPIKGLEYTVQAIPLIQKRLKKMNYPGAQKVTYILAGRFNENQKPYFDRIQKMISRITDPHLRKRIRMITNCDESFKRELFDMTDIFMYTPVAEPFGIGLAESLARCRVVVTSAVEGPKLILDLQDIKPPFSVAPYGILVPFTDPSTRSDWTAEAVVHALSHKNEFQALADKGRDFVESHFSWHSLVERKIALYEEILKENESKKGAKK